MVKAPEKFLNEYLSHEKGLAGKTRIRASKVRIRKVSNDALARLKQNLQTIWGIYGTPEIKEILSRKHNIRFLDIEGVNVCLGMSFVDKGILMKYELDLGAQKELAGARMYKQDAVLLNRYFASERGVEDLLKTANDALRAIVDVLVDKEFSETDIWNAIAKGEQIHLSTVSDF